jgi:poly-beta-1,6-N-acetyl-D-glucosamine synthase
VTPPRYLVITPARNEQENLGHTLRSMAAQTVLPAQWIIVNDGSNDSTTQIIDEAAAKHPWILPVHRADRGFRQQGGGVVEAFTDGLRKATVTDWEYLVKFDADLSFEPDYFERCFRKFDEEKSLGVGGGTISHPVEGKLVPESPGDPAFHVRGATKIYRRACWQALGGLHPAAGWDTIDELKANMLGWTTRSFPDIALTHHRFTGTVDGRWKNYVKFGVANYITGYHPMFMFIKCARRVVQRPRLVGALGLAYGYLSAPLRGIKKVPDPALIRFVRDQQVARLLFKPSLW